MAKNVELIQIPREETQQYHAFVVEVAKKVAGIFVDPEQMLWHYTNGAALIEIIRTSTIFATQVSCLNDSTEIRYGSRLLRGALSQSRSRFSGDAEATTFIDLALPYFEEDDGSAPGNIALPHFVLCFSELKDDLSQWRAYGGGENGYSIGFKAKHLVGMPSSLLHRVNYDEKVHAELAAEVAKATVDFYKQGLHTLGKGETELWAASFLDVWDKIITDLAPLVKHPGFAGEKECRVTKTLLAQEREDLRFVQKNTLMARHLVLRPPNPESEPYTLPISEVVIGPSRHIHVSRVSVATLLSQFGYGKVIMNQSNCPFQAT